MVLRWYRYHGVFVAVSILGLVQETIDMIIGFLTRSSESERTCSRSWSRSWPSLVSRLHHRPPRRPRSQGVGRCSLPRRHTTLPTSARATEIVQIAARATTITAAAMETATAATQHTACALIIMETASATMPCFALANRTMETASALGSPNPPMNPPMMRL